MPIQKTQSFVTTDSRAFAKLEDAQQHELTLFFGDMDHEAKSADIAQFVMGRREEIIGILIATGRKPRTRKARKPATPKAS